MALAFLPPSVRPFRLSRRPFRPVVSLFLLHFSVFHPLVVRLSFPLSLPGPARIKGRGRKNGDSCSTTGHRIDKENQIAIPRTRVDTFDEIEEGSHSTDTDKNQLVLFLPQSWNIFFFFLFLFRSIFLVKPVEMGT